MHLVPLSFQHLLFAVVVSAGQLANGAAAIAAENVNASAALPPDRRDLVSAAVAEASARFRVPEDWIRSVMHQESRLEVSATSPAGAMGLMQVMPGTYAELQARYGLGADPYDVRNNVLAGTAYLREMFDRYGAPGFLAAYNAGPKRWEEHLAAGRALPAETVDYVGTLGPLLNLDALPDDAADTALAQPLPDKSLIFVTLASGVGAASPTSKQEGMRADLSNQTTTKQSAESVFVRRLGAIGPLSGQSRPSDRRAKAASTPSSSRSVSTATRARESSLFVARPSTASGP